VIGAGELQPENASDAPPAAAITLAQAREKALAASPELQALAAQLLAADGASRQAGAYANPDIVLEVEDFGGGSSLDVASQNTFRSPDVECSARSARTPRGRV
jgi:hypothetical protein